MYHPRRRETRIRSADAAPRATLSNDARDGAHGASRPRRARDKNIRALDRVAVARARGDARARTAGKTRRAAIDARRSRVDGDRFDGTRRRRRTRARRARRTDEWNEIVRSLPRAQMNVSAKVRRAMRDGPSGRAIGLWNPARREASATSATRRARRREGDECEGARCDARGD